MKTTLSTTFLLAIFALPLNAFSFDLGTPLKPHIATQLIVQLNSEIDSNSLLGNSRAMTLPEGAQIDTIYTRKVKSRNKSVTQNEKLILISARSQQDIERLGTELEARPEVNWISPNFIYQGDSPSKSFEPTEEELIRQRTLPHEIMDNFAAWEITKGNKHVIIAVTDDGVDINHPDLQGGLWYNTNEVPLNGIDDDGNGFIDDVDGWDFSDEDQTVLPSRGNHGTFVTGVISGNGREENAVLGIAPDARVLPIRFTTGHNRWTSSVISKSYHYAVENGAKIINTSYNVDSMVDDPTYLDAINFANESGVFVINSAGNNRNFNPPRSRVPGLILVASTDTEKRYRDMRSYFSNYGPEIDISAPGQDIYSTEQMGARVLNSGTSFSTPFVAGAIALVWSHYPELTREQIWSRITATTDDIDRIHIDAFKGRMGAGRLNTYRALTENVPPPTIRGIDSVPNDSLVRDLDRIYVNLKNVFDSDSVNDPDAFKLINLDTGDEIPFTSKTVHTLGTNQIKMPLSEALPFGRYQFRARADILMDPFGQHLDGNGDGIPGDDFVINFESSIKGKRIKFYY